MILHHLCAYYNQLVHIGADVAPAGFFVQGVAFELVIEKSGKLVNIVDLRVPAQNGKGLINKKMILPGTSKLGGVGFVACEYGWERCDYMLGYINPDLYSEEERPKKLARCAEAHEFFKGAMNLRRTTVNAAEFEAFHKFLSSWKPENAEQFPFLADVSTCIGIVRIEGQAKYLHEHPQVHKECLEVENPDGVCLVSGQKEKIARIHDIKIKGVFGAQSSGASLISFNLSCCSSYAKEQGYNAPVGKTAAFKYCTALNKLLDRDHGHRIQVGDATIVFWAETPSRSEQLFHYMVNDFSGVEMTQEALEIESLLHAIEVGSEAIPDRHVTMHVLAISPNAARLSVRFFHTGTIGSIIENLIRNRTNMRLAGSVKGSMNLPIWLLLSHTARESKDVSPALAGHLAHSLVAGTPFPETFYSALLRRIKSDRSLDTARVAAIKAFLIHNHGMALTAGLDESRKEEAYHLGRVFACLERAQEDALPSLNFTIKDRYFSLASVSPGQHFPSLFLKSQHFMAKLEGGRRVYAEKRIKMIMANVSSIPAHLSILEQGLFIVGYYHQRQLFFTKKADTSTSQSDSNTNA